MPPMKNIYNLLSDAFQRIHEDERTYTVKVVDKYKVTITKNEVAGVANLELFLNTRDELFDYDDSNSLFNNDAWSDFCMVIEYQIPMVNHSLANAIVNLRSNINSFITANELFRNLVPPPLAIPQNEFAEDFDELPQFHNQITDVENPDQANMSNAEDNE